MSSPGQPALEENDLFSRGEASSLPLDAEVVLPGLRYSLLACDAAACRLYMWNPWHRFLSSVDITSRTTQYKQGSPVSVGLCGDKHQILQIAPEVDFDVRCLLLNNSGNALALVGEKKIAVVTLQLKQSLSTSGSGPSVSCSSSVVGASGNLKSGKIIQASWHPHSDSHLAVLNSHGVWRLYNLATDSVYPEQEFHLHPESGNHPDAGVAGARPLAVAFAFGGDHLWERFSVFALFSDGSIYVLCPVVPFGSWFPTSLGDQLHRETLTKSGSEPAPTCAQPELAAAWLAGVLPRRAAGEGEPAGAPGPPMVQAEPFVLGHASLALQGPLPVLGGDPSAGASAADAVPSSFLYAGVGKDTVLAVATRKGQALLYALGAEVQPGWSTQHAPRVARGGGGVLGVAAVARPAAAAGCPLLLLALVDLALGSTAPAALPALLPDPHIPERILCHHRAGIDSMVLQWLPHSDAERPQAQPAAAWSPLPPDVRPILQAQDAEDPLQPGMLGVVALVDERGDSWVLALGRDGLYPPVALPPRGSRGHDAAGLLPPPEEEEGAAGEGERARQLLDGIRVGPRGVPLPSTKDLKGRMGVDAGSVEGQVALHEWCLLLDEKYVDYAHQAHVEMVSSAAMLKHVEEEEARRLQALQDVVRAQQARAAGLRSHVSRVLHAHTGLRERLHKSSDKLLRAAPLTEAERKLKRELDSLHSLELRALQGLVEELVQRVGSAGEGTPNRSSALRSTELTSRQQLENMQAAVMRLSGALEDMTQQVKVIRAAVTQAECKADANIINSNKLEFPE